MSRYNYDTIRYVYFLRRIDKTGPVKIGCSVKPETRLNEFSAWSPYPLEIAASVPGSFELEDNLHDCFFDLHSHYEWFLGSPRIDDLIDKLNAGVPVAEAIDLNDRRGSIKGKVGEARWAARRAATLARKLQ